MKFLLGSCLLLAASALQAQAPAKSTPVAARATLHTDGTRTDSVKDLLKHQLTETTYNGRGVVIAKKMFLLGENGEPTQGVIYDGADNVIARVQFFFDDLGRVVEERCSNNQNEVFQRVIRAYDVTGKPLTPQVVNLPVKSPTMRPATLDFTNSPKAPPRRPTAQSAPAQPGQAPQIEIVSPGSGAVSTTPAFNSDPAMPPNLQVPQTEAPKEDAKKRSKLNPLNWFRKDK